MRPIAKFAFIACTVVLFHAKAQQVEEIPYIPEQADVAEKGLEPAPAKVDPVDAELKALGEPKNPSGAKVARLSETDGLPTPKLKRKRVSDAPRRAPASTGKAKKKKKKKKKDSASHKKSKKARKSAKHSKKKKSKSASDRRFRQKSAFDQ